MDALLEENDDMLWSPDRTAYVASVVAEVCRELAETKGQEDLMQEVVILRKEAKKKKKRVETSDESRRRPSPASSPTRNDDDDSIQSADLEPQELLKRARSRFMEECLNNHNHVLDHDVDSENNILPIPLPHEVPKHKELYNQDGRIGLYTVRERQAILSRFQAKKQKRKWDKTIRYNVRKSFADQRRRIKGRFVKHYKEKDSPDKNETETHDKDSNHTNGQSNDTYSEDDVNSNKGGTAVAVEHIKEEENHVGNNETGRDETTTTAVVMNPELDGKQDGHVAAPLEPHLVQTKEIETRQGPSTASRMQEKNHDDNDVAQELLLLAQGAFMTAAPTAASSST